MHSILLFYLCINNVTLMFIHYLNNLFVELAIFSTRVITFSGLKQKQRNSTQRKNVILASELTIYSLSNAVIYPKNANNKFTAISSKNFSLLAN